MSGAPIHKGWYQPRRLPHFDGPNLLQSVTYRLADSMPRRVIDRFQSQMQVSEDELQQRQLRQFIEDYLDKGYGSCLLRQEPCAQMVYDEWMRNHRQTYDLHAWVIMPNHVHVLIRLYPEASLPQVVGSWKRWSAKAINAHCNKQGALWQAQFWDRYIRDEDHYQRTIAYIQDNPVKAGLVARPDQWRWSSAHPRWATEPGGRDGVPP